LQYQDGIGGRKRRKQKRNNTSNGESKRSKWTNDYGIDDFSGGAKVGDLRTYTIGEQFTLENDKVVAEEEEYSTDEEQEEDGEEHYNPAGDPGYSIVRGEQSQGNNHMVTDERHVSDRNTDMAQDNVGSPNFDGVKRSLENKNRMDAIKAYEGDLQHRVKCTQHLAENITIASAVRDVVFPMIKFVSRENQLAFDLKKRDSLCFLTLFAMGELNREGQLLKRSEYQLQDLWESKLAKRVRKTINQRRGSVCNEMKKAFLSKC